MSEPVLYCFNHCPGLVVLWCRVIFIPYGILLPLSKPRARQPLLTDKHPGGREQGPGRGEARRALAPAAPPPLPGFWDGTGRVDHQSPGAFRQPRGRRLSALQGQPGSGKVCRQKRQALLQEGLGRSAQNPQKLPLLQGSQREAHGPQAGC